MRNATLVIHNGKEFENDIWQTNDNFNQIQWAVAVDDMADILQDIYNKIDNLQSKTDLITDAELYVLGDAINMLDSIDVTLEQ